MTESHAELRRAVNRLMAAIAKPDITVTVQRRDIEMLLLVVSQAQRQVPKMPNLNPNQR